VGASGNCRHDADRREVPANGHAARGVAPHRGATRLPSDRTEVPALAPASEFPAWCKFCPMGTIAQRHSGRTVVATSAIACHWMSSRSLSRYERMPYGETDHANGRQPARACLGEEDNGIEPAGVAWVREPRPCQLVRSLWGGQWRSTPTVNCGASRPSEDVVRIWASVDPTGWRVRRTVLDPNAAGNL